MDEGTNNNMKYANIVLNAWTSLILSLVGNFELPEQATNFAQIQVKMNKFLETRLSGEDKLFSIEGGVEEFRGVPRGIGSVDERVNVLKYVGGQGLAAPSASVFVLLYR
jgi:hypothetical protein